MRRRWSSRGGSVNWLSGGSAAGAAESSPGRACTFCHLSSPRRNRIRVVEWVRQTNANGIVTMTSQKYEALHGLERENTQLREAHEALRQQNEQLRQQVAYLEEQIHLLRHRLFGASERKAPQDLGGIRRCSAFAV